MLTYKQMRDIINATDRLSSQGHLLEKPRDAHEERVTLLLIGDEAATLSKTIEQVLAPWNRKN
jgi:hypothetical protein